MKLFRTVIPNVVFVIQVLIIVLLLFRQGVVVPGWLQPAGRFHTLVLHFPVALIVVLLLITLFRKKLGAKDSYQEVFTFLLYLTAFFTSLSALLGLLLSKEEGYDAELLDRHLWFGVAVSFLSYVLLLLYSHAAALKRLFHATLGVTFILLLLGSHFGAGLTHGEDYLFQPLQQEVRKKNLIITDSTSIFAAVVDPILESKCYSCHNEKKAKGELVMTSVEKLLKGGKDGPIWKAGDPANSRLIQRLQLEPDNKKHMPPRGKAQLSQDEIEFIRTWIQQGADMNKAFKDYAERDSFRVFASRFVQPAIQKKTDTLQYTFAFADEKLIARLNNPNRSISSLAANSPALQVSFFIRQQYQPELLKELTPLKQQVISLNMTNMPVKDEEVKTIAQFTNLEKLVLNGTGITDKTLPELKRCIKLKSLSLSNTKITAEAFTILPALPSLREVYLWNTGIPGNLFAAAEKQNQKIKWYTGYVPDAAEKLKLTPPLPKYDDKVFLSAGDSIVFTHPMPGVTIRYTTDGTDPDSTGSPEYRHPFPVSMLTALTAVKTRAVKNGWYCSDVAEYIFFRQGIKPLATFLLTMPEPEFTGQAELSLTDLKKGFINALQVNWLGYRKNDFSVLFHFEQNQPINQITLSVAKHVYENAFPPEKIEVWGGVDSLHLQLIGKLVPAQPKKYESPNNMGIAVPVKKGDYQYLKVVVSPLSKLPQWHVDKGVKARVFIDEIFFQ